MHKSEQKKTLKVVPKLKLNQKSQRATQKAVIL